MLAAIAQAEVPQLITVQGRLTDASGAPVTDGPYLIKFKIYGSADGSDSLWSSGFQTVTLSKGLFTYQLGSSEPLPEDLFTDTLRWLGITVGTDAEITPRTRLTSQAYASQSLRADTSRISATVYENAITGAEILDGTIMDADISSTAEIAPSKISGTVATLSGVNHFTADNYIDSGATFYIGENTLRADNNGIIVGNTYNPPSPGYLFTLSRFYDTSSSCFGLKNFVANSDTGDVYACYISAGYSSSQGDGSVYGIRTSVGYSSGGNGTVYGFYGNVNNNLSSSSSRYGAYISSGSSSNTAGYSYGVRASAYGGLGTYAVYGYAKYGVNSNYAGYFNGDVHVTGTMSKAGGSFKIDHPLDPEHKYLQHSFVESPDMMNIYNGNVILDAAGEATVVLPDYFEALNMDFRYQLTAIGAPGPNLYVAEEISGNRFRIAGGEPGMKVSWQVTGIRHDKWAEAHRVQVEVDKRPEEIGKYIHPEEWGQPIERSVDYDNIKEDLEAAEERARDNFEAP